MSRLSIRPRPLDFHKKLPVVKSVKDFEDDETPSGTRNAQLLRLVESETEVPQVSSKKLASEIPTPQFVVVDTYERDYSQTFAQPTSYLRARAARAEIGEFIEYDLDNEDDDWLEEFNKERRILSPEKFETILFKLEVSDHKARERAGVIIPTLGPPVPVLLTFDAAVEALQSLSIKYGVFQSIYNYWKEKRERWQKPILRRLQPPPPVNDTNPYNVFRPRERPNRLHTRRMQRRENNVQSFEKLRQVRRNLEQARTVLDALVKREEKKREVMESEVSLQRMQLKYKNETELLEDTLALPGLPSFPTKAISSDEEFVDSDDLANSDPRMRPSAAQNLPFMDSQQGASSSRRRPNGWMHRMDPDEPVMFFTKPLDLEQLAAAGIAPPPAPIPDDEIPAPPPAPIPDDDTSAPPPPAPIPDGGDTSAPPPAPIPDNITSAPPSPPPSPPPPFTFRPRFGRGGRIIFDRSDPLMLSPPDCGEPSYVAPRPRRSVFP